MAKLLLVPVFIALLCSSLYAQEKCPTISLIGPPGIVAVGELATFTATVGGGGANGSDLGYSWTISAGEIFKGQGTNTLQVKVSKNENITVTVTISGLPGGCNNIASETKVADYFHRKPIKLDQFTVSVLHLKSDRLERIVNTIKSDPSAGIYILIGNIDGRPSQSNLAREQELIEFLSRNGIDNDRIDVRGVYAEIELIQIWLSPAGAGAPDCVECTILKNELSSRSGESRPSLKPQNYDPSSTACDSCVQRSGVPICPSLSIEGPRDLPKLNAPVTFKVSIRGSERYPDITYHWLVSGGPLLSGQGTNTIRVSQTTYNDNLTATVEISGLPHGCLNHITETAPIF